MPSHLHEVLVDMFRERPEFAAELLGGPLGVQLPAYQQARASPADLTDLAPTEYRADAVVTLTAADTPVTAVVVEVQLRPDPRKRFTWPVYVASLHARRKCPVYLLVLCPTAAVAAWSAEPIVVSDPGLVLTPVVLGPDQVPVVDDPRLARRHPEVAVLSAIAHGDGLDQKAVFETFLAALASVDHDRARLYSDVVLKALPKAARDNLETLMSLASTYEVQSDFLRRIEARAEGIGEARGEARGAAKGEAKGEAKAVLAVLDARGIDVADEARQDIVACTDLDRLDTWIRRAVTARTVAELFDES